MQTLTDKQLLDLDAELAQFEQHMATIENAKRIALDAKLVDVRIATLRFMNAKLDTMLNPSK